MRILVVKRDKLGDMLLTTPLIFHLASAGHEVAVLASEYCGWVVRGHPAVHRLWTYPRLSARSIFSPSDFLRYSATFRDVRRQKFDVALAAGGEFSPRAVEKALSAWASRTIAYAPDGHRFGPRLTDRLEPPTSGHEMDRMLAMAKALGVPPPSTTLYPEYRLPDGARDFATAWLKERGLAPGRYVVLGLGTRRPVRQPSAEQILRWTARWRDECGLQTVFMWTPGKGSRLYPGDDLAAEPVLAAGRADIHPFRGPILEAIGLIFHAVTSVFPDSGLMHFAAASPGGVLGLFASSPSWPDQWAPRGPRARWLLAEQAVADLDDGRVFEALTPLLQRAGT